MAYFGCTFLYFVYILLFTSQELYAGELRQFTSDMLQMAYAGRPVCVFFKHAATLPDYEELLANFLKSEVAIKYADWTIGSVMIEDIAQMSQPPNLYPSMVPSLQCDIGLQFPLEFMFQNKSLKSLKKWFKHVSKEHSSQVKFATSSSELENAIFNNHRGITVLLIVEMSYFHSMTSVARKVRKYEVGVSLNVLIARSEYVEYWQQKASFCKLEKYPAILLFTYEVWATTKSPAYVLQGQHEVSASNIQLALMAVAAKFVFMDKERFLEEVLDTKYQLAPKLVLAFSYSNPNSLKYFSNFDKIRKQMDCEGVLLEFRLMDIGKRNNSLVFSRHINGTNINTFPVFVLFWQEMTAAYEIKVRHEVLNDLLTAAKLYSPLVKNGILEKVKRNNKNNNIDCFEGSDDYGLQECANLAYSRGICVANASMVLEVNRKTTRTPVRSEKKQKKVAKIRKLGKLTLLTDPDWSSAIEASSLTRSTERLQGISVSPVMSLVFFIVKKCRYCEIILPKLEKLAETFKRPEEAAIFLVNCSLSPTICKRQNVQGYPSVKLFRSLPWSHLGACAPERIQQQQYIALDYHRPLEPLDLILEWFSNSSLPSVKKKFLLSNIPKKLDHNVYLVGTVVTRSQASRFLPAHTHNMWYPVTCFQAACELLFGNAVCYVTMTKDFGISNDMKKTKNKDLFLIKLELFRRDGIEAKIFELGVPLETTMRHEQDSELHKFHNPHRYSLENGFRCENNHSRCTEFIVMFVSDHSRLPVTQLSHDGFHTINKLLSDGIGLSEERPVVIILAHKENLTSHNSYSQEVNEAAYELYRDAIFASLDVDEYSWWARQFVPQHYDTMEMTHSSDLEYTPPLYHYPRLCIVKTSDHHRAAFLPDLETMASAKNIPKLLQSVNAKEIIKFVKRYLQKPELFLVKTEEF